MRLTLAVVKFTWNTPEETHAFGVRLAALLRAGDLLVLSGPLGAGKTALTQGIGAGLGVRGPITSPTFVIARAHEPDAGAGGVVPLVHVDAYRLGGVGEVDHLDLEADVEDSVTVVEWGGGLVDHLAEAHLEIAIERPDVAEDAEFEPRTAVLTPHGGDWEQRLNVLREIS
ncbi:MAG: tRNA (adenosine(37)-N6)-threonylcarbamoyltransferase complex ATPase subunit type 1 TsaE [Corynebacteriales bacterium]|nr:tRNA (adenosine(37)-N6)-threonylcarbamoyltransferase complex ATPase subunit type 1 TsaE [Mycobacteriales bacterium]